MKRILSILTMIMLSYCTAEAQNAITTWALTGNQNANVFGAVNANSQFLSALQHVDYISGGQRTIPIGNSWPAESAANTSRYMQYTIAPNLGQTLNVNKIEASLSFNGSSAGRANLAWSTDKINFTPIAGIIKLNSSATPTAYTFDNLNINIHQGDTLYLRLYPWTTAIIPSKYLVASNIKINGNTSISPQATWALTADQTATTNGHITASNQRLQNLDIQNYVSSNGGQRTLPPSKSWPAETTANANRFIEYKITPTAAHDAIVKETSVPLSFNSSAYARANIAWSVDGINFSNLAPAVALASGSTPIEHLFQDLNIPVPFGKSFYLRVYPWTTSAISDKYLVSKNIRLKIQTKVMAQIAFPGAEGGGRNATGARGGQIYYVTNLNDAGVGSLRDAVSEGNRTVLFKISGTIFLESPIVIQKDGITIAGQTAPGGGICLANYGLSISANNVIVRYLRSRPGDVITRPGDSTKAVDAMYNAFGTPIKNPYRNIIVDHCSLSWSTDEAASFYAVADFTLQWSILSESLYMAAHPKPTAHGYGGIWGGQNSSFHHNLLASHSNRNPRFSGSENNNQPDLEYVDFRNNVIFNWYGGTYGGIGGHQNMVNNYYKSGPATVGTSRKKRLLSYSNSTAIRHGKFYITGNYVNGFADVTADNWLGVDIAAGISLDSIKVNTPFMHTAINTQSATDAYTDVLNHAGASLPKRDTVDRRIVKEVQTGIATFGDPSFSVSGMVSPSGMIDSQYTVGGWPTLHTTAYPDDSDNDGLPNWWEAMQNGHTADSTSVNPNAFDTDGYTFLEKYINGIPPSDQQTVFTSITGSRINNGDTVKIDFQINWANNQSDFALYRSTDGLTFTKIKNIASNINQTNYSFEDIFSATSAVYYKVGSSRNNDSEIIHYSNSITIGGIEGTLALKAWPTPKKASNEKNAFMVYPNPANQQINVQHSAASAGSTITITDMTGKILSCYHPLINQANSTINISRLPQGSYLLVFKNNSIQQNIIFLKN